MLAEMIHVLMETKSMAALAMHANLTPEAVQEDLMPLLQESSPMMQAAQVLPAAKELTLNWLQDSARKAEESKAHERRRMLEDVLHD